LALYAYPQWRGCRRLQKGLDMGRDPRKAYRYVQRHQLIQRVLCILELMVMIWFNLRFLIWQEVITTMGYATDVTMVLIILCRMQALGIVDQFGNELLKEIRGDGEASGQYKYKRMGEAEGEKAGKKKGEKDQEKAHIDFFNIV